MNPRTPAPKCRPRVLVLGPDLDAVSGVATHLRQLFNSEIATEFELSHLQVGREDSDENVPRTIWRLVSSVMKLVVKLSLEQPAIVHINATFDHRSFPRDALYLAVSRGFGRKVVFQVHGGELPRDLCRGSSILSRLIRAVLRAAHAVVLLGSTQLEAFSEFVPDANFDVIPNAVDPGTDVHLPEHAARGPLNLVFMGRLAKEKGVHECVEAAGILNRSGRQFKMTIAGSGPEQAALEAHINALDLGDSVDLAGPVFGVQKDTLWRQSQIFVFPSYTREGLPYALLEGMAAGVVPITTPAGATPEVVEDGVQGLFVRAKDPYALFEAIAKLDDDRDMLLRMSSQAILRVQDGYTIDRMTNSFAHLYRSLVSQRNRKEYCSHRYVNC